MGTPGDAHLVDSRQEPPSLPLEEPPGAAVGQASSGGESLPWSGKRPRLDDATPGKHNHPNQGANGGEHRPHVAPHVTHPHSLSPDLSAQADAAAPEDNSAPGQAVLVNCGPAPTPEKVAPPHAAAAWARFRALGSPRFHVAPMVDQSELPFRMLCRKYGASAAYTPMLHARLFAQEPKYRKEFSTCPEDRPLFVQFCANDPDVLVEAASLVAHECDYVDLNFGCPQRIAKKGNYGAFLMDNLPLVESLVQSLSRAGLPALVSAKIRVFPDAARTLHYARMIEAAGCSLLAVHGRTREQKDQRAIRADWDAIRLVKDALSIPVLANGNVRNLADAHDCLRATGCDGVLSAESLLANPALFAGYELEHAERSEGSLGTGNMANGGARSGDSNGGQQTADPIALTLEYLDLCDKYPVPMRMVRAHLHRMLGNLFRLQPHVREKLNKEYRLSIPWLRELVLELKHALNNSRANPSGVPAS